MQVRKKTPCSRIYPVINGPVIWLKRLIDRDLPSRKKIIRIKTDDIGLFMYNDFLIRNCTIQGNVVGGDWDLRVRTKEDILTNTDKYNGIREHFMEGIPWEQTILFRNEYRKRFEIVKAIKGARSLTELARVYEKKYDALYDRLKQDGFLSIEEDPHVDPVYIYLNRHGKIIYTSNGNHRLAMVFLLGIDEIPVQIWWRHKQWQETRKKFAKLDQENRKRQYPDLSGHPDLLDI